MMRRFSIRNMMDNLMGKSAGFLMRCDDWVLPLSFSFSSLLNLGFFYLGLAYVDNVARKYGYILGCVCFAVVSGLLLLGTLRTNRPRGRQLVLLGAVIAFFGIAFGGGLWKAGFRGVLYDYLKVFIVLSLPTFFAGIIAAVKSKEASFFKMLEQMAFFGMPAAMIYVHCAMFDTNPFTKGTSLGFLNYMSFAYTLMPLLLAMVIRFSNSDPLTIPFINKRAKHPQAIRLVMILYYWVAIVASGTRGAYVCVAVFCGLLCLSKLAQRIMVRRAVLISFLLAAILFFTMFVYAPPGMHGVQRMTFFLEHLLSGELVTSDSEKENVLEFIDDLIQSDGNKPTDAPMNPPTDAPMNPPTDAPMNPPTDAPMNPPTDAPMNPPTGAPTDPLEVAPTEPVADDPTEIPDDLQISDRSTLYKLAIGEFLKNPLFGMGPGGYCQKYETYPHNAILEMLCETGIVGTIFLCLLLLIAIVRIIRAGIKDHYVWYMFLFFLTYAIQANISGSLWECAALLGALGYGLALPSVRE